MMERMIRKITAAAAACVLSSTGHCLDGVAVEIGHGDDRTSLLRIAISKQGCVRPSNDLPQELSCMPVGQPLGIVHSAR